MRLLSIIRASLILILFAGGGFLLYGYFRSHPEDLPWTPLDLSQPVGTFTGRKLAGLNDFQTCRALLNRAGVRFTALPPRAAGSQCGYDDAVRLLPERALAIGYRPEGLATSCRVAATIALWEWHVVQPAAQRHFGRSVTAIDHLGSYNCRRIGGGGAWSEHATANAVDIAAFRLEGGRCISILSDWDGDPAEQAFLRDVRDGAGDLFATVLSPDYNAAHRDHLHFDQADRGRMGWRGCR
ncbi:extensin family protein [Allosphingosinicella vermicomposti]|uniref:extensin-like domain-containing protein n=1 Tax=Allosphingosinicella vermicomposti TaxID=614671 RepID=UPI000D11435B|nr:extensin family protein [Allosphingosinicella vermicomposti]